MKIADIQALAMSELKDNDGTYTKLEVIRTPAGYYIGRIFNGDDGIVEPGSRESEYFPTSQKALKALMKGFEWRDVAENRHLYDRHKYRVRSQEEGRGPVDTKSFATLVEASRYIQEIWQGADYVDSDDAFHTDYCTYRISGFKLSDIGTRISEFWRGRDGTDYYSHMEFKFKKEEDL